MYLQNTVLSEINQTHNLNHHMVSLICVRQISDKENVEGRTERDKRMELLQWGSGPRKQRRKVRKRKRGDKNKDIQKPNSTN